ncbi:hypothetical protein BACOVA_02782 [Bacteroides ovatus ATCC 8483]|uniref:Uncharacterized protein n=1 Tax=Bacteroides ovatus (strain ATCC 8483 / DSM 1896 / JCM 5824 / BCRC 10623 / CCUG 4943 / NCTC 11153) TaxID=411476 RepID=A0AAN3D828_BACO1|nr:hypothetical protein BACOVA_02782 [Bacteroides ovatus ATCC 8483]
MQKSWVTLPMFFAYIFFILPMFLGGYFVKLPMFLE